MKPSAEWKQSRLEYLDSQTCTGDGHDNDMVSAIHTEGVARQTRENSNLTTDLPSIVLTQGRGGGVMGTQILPYVSLRSTAMISPSPCRAVRSAVDIPI